MAKATQDPKDAQGDEVPDMPQDQRSGFDMEGGSANSANYPEPETPSDEDLAVPPEEVPNRDLPPEQPAE